MTNRYRNDWTLATACEALHMGNNGSADPLPRGVVSDLADWLRWRLDNWTPSGSKEEIPYDKAYRGLIRATLAEIGRDPHGYPKAPEPDGLLADPVIVQLQDQLAAMTRARDAACDLVESASEFMPAHAGPSGYRSDAARLRKVGQ